MSPIRTFAALMVGLSLYACELPTAPLTPGIGPTAPTTAVISNEPHVPFDFAVVACAEVVYGSGFLHLLERETLSVAEDTITGFHVNARGEAVGSTSGARYRFNDTFRIQTHLISGAPLIASISDRLNLIGQGMTADLHVRTTFRLTINANGIETVLIDEMRVTCT